MKSVKYGQAAIIAAILALTGNAVRAQESCPLKNAVEIYKRRITEVVGYDSSTGRLVRTPASGDCCKEGKCCSSYKPYDVKCSGCKDGQCCKTEDCCNSKKCDAKCSCCKDSKCSCCEDGKCGCDKDGKCSCEKDKTSVTKTGCASCPFASNLAKRTAIIMVMPASMPLPACCMEAMGMLPHPPMPPGPHVFLPPMMPPMPPIPPTPSMGIGAPVAMPPMPTICPPCAYQDWSYRPIAMPPMPGVCPPGPGHIGNTVWAECPGCAIQCCTTPATSAKVCIIAASSSDQDQLAMQISDDTCIRCKKMTIKIGDNEITVSRFDDRVRVRGEDLKATADCVRTEGKDGLILEGKVVMHCKKDGRSANVIADRVGLDLSNGTVAIQRVAKPSTIGITPVIHESK